MSKSHVRHGFRTVRPYLYGPYDTPGSWRRYSVRERSSGTRRAGGVPRMSS